MMGKWKVGAITGAVWGLISLATLSGGIWLNPLIKYTFGLPTTLTFHIVNWLNFIIVPIIGIWFSYIVLFLLAPTIRYNRCRNYVFDWQGSSQTENHQILAVYATFPYIRNLSP